MNSTHLLQGAAAGLALFAGMASAQSLVQPAPLSLLNDVGLYDGTVQDLELPAAPGEAFEFVLWIDGGARSVSVWPYSLRAPGYKLMVLQPDGSYVQHAPTVETTYRGEIEGYPGSVVAVNLFNGQLQGTISLTPGAPLWGVQPVSEFDPTAALSKHLVYSGDTTLPMNVSCGTDELLHRMGEHSDPETPGAAEGGPTTKVCQIAFDADFEFYQQNGSSVTQTENDITNILNSVEAIYDSEVEILYELTAIFVEASEPDPYSTSSSSGLLNQFQNHWNSQHGGTVRDVAHLMTGKNLSGSTIGIAYLNVICNLGSAYGLSQSKYTGSFTNRVGLTAHELGHNWNAPHCDGASDCRIMCSCLGCCGPVTTFGVGSENKILNKKASSGCLSTPPPPAPPLLTGINPGTAQAFGASPVTLSGFFLEDTTAIHVGSSTLPAPFGFTIVDDNTITFTPPTASALGSTSVTAENDAGVSNAVSLNIVETDPAKLAATATTLTGLAFNWSFGGKVNDLWFLFATLNDNSTIPLFGYDILANGVFLSSGSLSAAGTGGDGIIVPSGASGATVYSQVLLLDDVTFGFVEATNITTSTIIL